MYTSKQLLMSRPLIGFNRSALYWGGMGRQSINKVVKKASSPRSLHSALEARMVGCELRHRRGVVGMQIMYEDKWASRFWFLAGICNIAIPLGEESTITFQS